MARWDDEESLIRDVLKPAERKLYRKLTWQPPYDDSDREELAGFLWPTTRGKGDGPGPKHEEWLRRWCLLAKLESERLNHLDGLRHLALLLRKKVFGLSSPVSLDRIEDELMKIGGTRGLRVSEDEDALPYPILDWTDGKFPGLRVWQIGYVYLPSSKPEDISRFHFIETCMSFVSRGMGCHPGASLAFLLCDIPIHEDVVSAAIEGKGTGISLQTKYPEAPNWLVQLVYAVAKHIALNLTRGRRKDGRRRPRAVTERMSALLAFVKTEDASPWKQRWEDWNTTYPEWAYPHQNTMQATYYRAKRWKTGLWSKTR